eukprot:TRINITY_DN136501_c0_g1_i1.p1 TRINITY_DN136501_c0_g1~~TRINITY_DN136501_c0_g1_i1.p1  ORF type:complete len:217 (+),score=54.03 TRINITY_DN136501_c0_g1_i1:36-686(+)
MSDLSPAGLRKIMSEMMDLTQNPPEDIKVIFNDEDISDIQAILNGPAGTPYEGGQFKVRLRLGNEFPKVPPKGYFLTKIFHPNVSASGDICVNTLKKDWKEDLGIKHILLTIKCLLIVPNPESALNEEAGRLLLEQYDDYARKAKLMTSIHAKVVASSSASSSNYSDENDENNQNNENQSNNENISSSTKTKKVALKKKRKVTKKKTEKRKRLKRL